MQETRFLKRYFLLCSILSTSLSTNLTLREIASEKGSELELIDKRMKLCDLKRSKKIKKENFTILHSLRLLNFSYRFNEKKMDKQRKMRRIILRVVQINRLIQQIQDKTCWDFPKSVELGKGSGEFKWSMITIKNGLFLIKKNLPL